MNEDTMSIDLEQAVAQDDAAIMPDEIAAADAADSTPDVIAPEADTAVLDSEAITPEANVSSEASPEVVDESTSLDETSEATEPPDVESKAEATKPPGVDPALKNKVEAVLFVTDKALYAQAIARIINADVQLVRQALLELINQYESHETALEIAQDNGYMIEVKPEYATIMQEFLPLDIPASLLRTLSAIAIRAPVAQSEIVQMRGAGAYDHIRELVERELVHKKEEGRSPILTTTKKFQQYFRLSSDGSELRKYVKQQEKLLAEARAKAEAEAAAKAAAAEGGGIAATTQGAGNEEAVEAKQNESVAQTELESQSGGAVHEEPGVNAAGELQDFTPDTSGSLTD